MPTLVSKDTSRVLKPQHAEEEQIGARTRTAKRFFDPVRGEHRVGVNLGPIHAKFVDPYNDEEPYQEIDIDVVFTPNKSWDAEVTKNGYQVRYWNERSTSHGNYKCVVQYRRAKSWITFAPLGLYWENDNGEKQWISKDVNPPSKMEYGESFNRIIWKNAFGKGIHFQYNVLPDRFFKTVIIDSFDCLPVPNIGIDGLKLTIMMDIDWHRNGKPDNKFPDVSLDNPEPFAFKGDALQDLWWINTPKAWDSFDGDDRDHHLLPLEWRLHSGVGSELKNLFISVPAKDLVHPDVVYPVFIDIDIPEDQVAQSTDDAYAFGVFLPAEAQMVLCSTPSWTISGIRWMTVPIPNGVTITDAQVSVYEYDSRKNMNSAVYGDDEDNCNTFISLADMTGRPLTTAVCRGGTPFTGGGPWSGWGEIQFSHPPASSYTSDFVGVIKEVIDKPGWGSNNSLAIILKTGLTGGWTNGRCRTYDHSDNSYGPKLNVSYNIAESKTFFDNVPIDDTPPPGGSAGFTWDFDFRFDDIFSITDAPGGVSGMVWNLTKIFLEVFGIDDNTVMEIPGVGHFLTLGDTLDITDLRQFLLDTLKFDIFPITDVFGRALPPLTFLDVLTISDAIVRRLFGAAEPQIAPVLGDPRSKDKPWMLYVAVGTGNTPVDKFKDVALDEEVHRKEGDVRVVANTYFVRAVFGQDEPNSDDLTLYEIGIFDSPTNGKMGARWVMDTGMSKDNIDEIVVECAITILHGDILTYSDSLTENVGISDSIEMVLS